MSWTRFTNGVSRKFRPLTDHPHRTDTRFGSLRLFVVRRCGVDLPVSHLHPTTLGPRSSDLPPTKDVTTSTTHPVLFPPSPCRAGGRSRKSSSTTSFPSGRGNGRSCLVPSVLSRTPVLRDLGRVYGVEQLHTSKMSVP